MHDQLPRRKLLCGLLFMLALACAAMWITIDPGSVPEQFTGPIPSQVIVTVTKVPEEKQGVPEEQPVEEAPSRRMPIAGAAGFQLVIEADGSVHVHGLDGRRTLLDAVQEAEPVLVPTVVGPPSVPAQKKEIGRLVVLDLGVVDVPIDAVITYLGEDRAVICHGDGSATVYHIDGRVEHRERVDRRSPDKP